MPRIVSVIPPKDDSNITKAQGTKILLDNGEYLRCVHKITLVAEADSPWKAIIEVYPSNQEQIDALLTDLEVVKRNEAFNRLQEIQEEMQHLQDEKLFLEHKYLSGVTGVSIDGVKDVPKEGTWLLKEDEKILSLPNIIDAKQLLKNFSLHGSCCAIPDLKGNDKCPDPAENSDAQT
ncbi:hypothetical protein KWF60_17475 [Acinetobacter baumannii]